MANYGISTQPQRNDLSDAAVSDRPRIRSMADSATSAAEVLHQQILSALHRIDGAPPATDSNVKGIPAPSHPSLSWQMEHLMVTLQQALECMDQLSRAV